MNAIETTYKGYKFRSRLEAKWAFVFDQLDWDWEYEPVDFGGYIPDFLIMFGKEPWYVEIKPAKQITDFDEGLIKARASRGECGPNAEWSEPLLMLGARLGLSKFDRSACCNQGLDFFGVLDDTRFAIECEDLHFVICPTCGKHVIVTGIGSWQVPCGCEPPKGLGELVDGWPHKHWRWVLPANRQLLKSIWADAHNATRWMPAR